MKRKFIRYVETKIVLVAILVAGLCVGTGYGIYRHLSAVQADTEAQIASNLRARHLIQALMLIQDAETGQRGFLLTGRDAYLQPYLEALSRIDQGLATLQRDYADADAARSVTAAIDQGAHAKFAELRQTIELRRRLGLEAALPVVLQDTGKRLMDRIRADINQLLEVEQATIDRSALRQSAAARHTVHLWAVAAAVMLLPAGCCLILAFREVRQGRREGARLAHASSHDALTGILNRRALLARLDEALARRPQEVGLLYLDLNGFKAINDDLGHAVGDRLLVEVARRLEGTLRPLDAVARLGGDEFVVLVEACTSPRLLGALAARVESALGTIRLTERDEARIGASVGTAWSSLDGTSAEALLEAADAAMYRRKTQVRPASSSAARARLSVA